ncbi:hypothetical protein Tco_0122150 [Tanacetum coccineum]
MSGSDADALPPPPPPPQSQTPVVAQAPHIISTIKLPILKKGEYDVWVMKMEHYLAHIDYPLWEVIQKGNGPINVSTDTHGIMKVLPPKTAEETLAKERERKARTTLLLTLPEDHLAKFHKMTDAKEIWEAIKSRFGGNEESKKNKANDNSKRLGKKEESNALMTRDGGCVDWTSHSKDEQDNYAFMAYNTQLSDASIEILAYTQALKKVEAQLVAHQQSQLWYEEKIRFMKIDLDDKTDVLTYHKKLLAEAEKEKEDLKAKVEKWHNSSKNLGKLLNTQMSANDKFGLGYGDYRYDGILSYENEVLQSVFMNKESDLENQPLYDRFVTAEGMHVVPPPMTGNYMPSGPDIEIDYSQFTYGPKQSQLIVVFHEKKMAKQAELNNRMRKKSSQREIRPIWNNVQRMNHRNQFVPKAILTRTGKIPVNTARASGTNTVNTARHNVNRQAVPTNAANIVNTVKPIVNNARPKSDFHKSVSPFRKSLNRTTSLRTNFSYQKVNTAEVNAVSAVGGKGKLLLSPQQVVIGDQKDITGTKSPNTMMCDKKNKVLFTDTECLVLSPEFKLPDENQVLLRIPKQNNMYSFNLENTVPSGVESGKNAGPQDAIKFAGTEDNIDACDYEIEDESA